MLNHYSSYLKNILALMFFIFAHHLSSQTLNAYAKVTAINGTSTVLTLSNYINTAHSFADGEQIIVMQMQDNILNNTSNTNGFGTLTAGGLSAGKFEMATISSHTGGASFTTITLASALSNTYNINANSSVQIISFQLLGATYTTPSAITALNWNGNVGGVIALQVTGALTLTNNISANGAGFRGGSVSVNYYPGGTTCDTVANTWISGSNNRGEKGESVFLRTLAAQRYGKAPILNGGGGGVNINTGGGGGANYTAGGNSGPGWNGSAGGCPSGGQGRGGLDLSSLVSATRVFMGGGGGGGQQNDGVGTSEGNGGGIVLIEAGSIVTSGSCGGLSISANGTTPSASGNDGNGGGGGAGSIVLQVGSYSIAAGCALSITANGGSGGNVGDAATHAGGGGGGAGVIVFSGTQPSAPVTASTSPGVGGYNNSGHTSQASSGVAGSGLFVGNATPLPIELTSFTGHSEGVINKLEWITMSELNNNFFTLEHSKDAVNFSAFTTLKGAGNSISTIYYSTYDYEPFDGITYYRLKQTDYDGNFTYSDIIYIENGLDKITVENTYPNPTNSILNVDFYTPLEGNISIDILAYNGQLVQHETKFISVGNSSIKTNVSTLSSGIYFVKVMFDKTSFSFSTKIVKD
ncbi:MAG: T9SS type A sorting domain-containing protein [Bacteroidota bacterium]